MEQKTLKPPLCSKHGCEKAWANRKDRAAGGEWVCPECRRARYKRWNKAHPGAAKQQLDRWIETNPERHAAQSARKQARWVEAHPGRIKELARIRYAANPAKDIARVHKRNARKRAATSPLCKVTAAAIAERFALTDGCAYCGAEEKLTLDHVVPLNDGGLHVPSNLVGACSTCNSSKQDKPVEEWFRAQPFFSEQRWQRIQTITGQGQLSLI